jgi:hypothetical protein
MIVRKLLDSKRELRCAQVTERSKAILIEILPNLARTIFVRRVRGAMDASPEATAEREYSFDAAMRANLSRRRLETDVR